VPKEPQQATQADASPISVKDIGVGQPAQPVADPQTEEELTDLRQKMQEAQLASFIQNTQERKRYAERIHRLAVGWVIALFVVIFLQGSKLWGFQLPDSVLWTLVGSTTAGVLGMLGVVVAYLFKQPGP
jgi:hypothetical protein